MIQRKIKFRLIHGNKIVGYEMIYTQIVDGIREEFWMYKEDLNGEVIPWIPHTEKNQYVGRKDKNYKDIYNWDFLKGPRGRIGHVRWYRSGFTINWGEDFDWLCHIPNGYFEIVGNVYENPELLKECE